MLETLAGTINGLHLAVVAVVVLFIQLTANQEDDPA